MQRPQTHLWTALCLVAILCLPAVAQSGMTVVATSGNTIRTIDMVSGNTAATHPIAISGMTVSGTYGLARDPQTGMFYAVVSYTTGGGRFLASVDPATGVGANIGQTPILSDIAIAIDGTLYGIGGNLVVGGALFTVNKSNGVGTQIAQLSGGSGHVLAFNPEDGLLYHGYNNCGAFNCYFFTESFDPQTANINAVSKVTNPGIESGSFVHLRDPYFVVGSGLQNQFALVNVATGRISLLSADAAWTGLTTIPTAGTCPPAATLYATGPFEGPALLHSVDPATGVASLVGPIGFDDITGIDFATDGVLYALGRRGDDSGVQVLLTIDPCTGEGTEVGSTGISGTASLREMAAMPNGELYAFLGQDMETIDRVGGGAMGIGASGITADDFGLAYSSADANLYFANIFNGVGTLYTIDPGTGASAVVSQLTLPPNSTALRAMDFDPGSNTMYALIADSAFPGTTSLAIVNTSTHAVTSVASTSRFTTLAFKKGTPSASYQLTVNKAGSGNGTVASSPNGIDCGATCQFAFNTGTSVTLTATADIGSRFDGWSGACSGTGPCVVTMNAMRTVRPQFTQVYHLHLQYGATNQGAGGKVTISDPTIQVCLLDQGPCDLLVSAGSVVLHADAGPGSLFDKWETTCDSGDPANVDCTVTMSADRTVALDFLGPTRLTVKLITNDPGALVHDNFDLLSCSGANTCTFDYNPGATVTLLAAAGGISTFTGWSGDCTGTGACQVVMSSPRNVTATFTTQSYTLNVGFTGQGTGTVAGNGINCPGTCSVSNVYGTMLTLTATPSAESSFAGWSGACSGTGACQVTFDAAKNVTANFAFIGPFNLANTSLPLSVPAGQPGIFSLTVQEHTASSGTITFTCVSGLPAGSTCSFNPNGIAFTAGTNTSINTLLTITTLPRTLGMNLDPSGGMNPIWAMSLFALVFVVPRRRRGQFLLVVALAFVVFLPACGGGGGPTTPTKTQNGTAAGTYTVVINASTGSVVKTTTVTLVVQ